MTVHFMLLFSKQGKVRLSKYYSTFSQKERGKVRVQWRIRGHLRELLCARCEEEAARATDARHAARPLPPHSRLLRL